MLANGFIIFIMFLHILFMLLEMFFWAKPLGLKIFHLTPEFARQSAALAANQGLYNGILSAGLLWSVLSPDATEALHLKIFFLASILIAGLYGGITVGRRIFFIQGLPALIALILLIL